MAKVTSSTTKRSMIDKANSTMFASIAVASFLVIFCLVSANTLIGQANYQNKIITQKKKAVGQLKDNLEARDSLVTAYQAFVETPQNILGGSTTGSGPNDGDNAKLVLDALPSKYDFPALATSLEKLISSQNLQIQSITGTDQEVEQQKSPDGQPQPVAIPFEFQVSGSYDAIQNLVKAMDSSIRPFKVETMEVTGSQNTMTATINAVTYYQPEKAFKVTTETIN